ncbi:MAG: class I SAM-dependent methyltransferase [Planctomycetota bacterium]|nr:MAG: class I SAM-dependent methyltransferase [Planctomycetota bacterium]
MGTEPPHPDWFRPRALYRRGYPAELTSALQLLPPVRALVQRAVDEIGARYVLEVGPGRCPVARGPDVLYLDVSESILAALGTRAVVGDVRALPFADGMFDLALACDVLTHVPPAERERALSELCRVAPRVVVFQPEPGGGALAPPISAARLARGIERCGFEAALRPIVVPGPRGPLRMGLIVAERR